MPGCGETDGRTPEESQFLDALHRDGGPPLDVWPRADDDGTPWLCISLDVMKEGAVWRTLRLDFDGATLKGGWSPSCLNWDDGVRADDAGIDASPPDGIHRVGLTPEVAAALAHAWFDDHRRRLGAYGA
jgi:hypothetical protein